MNIRTTRSLVSLLLAALTLPGCGPPAQCGATGGEWSDCAAEDAWCVDGEVERRGDSPAICEAGCTCPADAPVWDAAAGCITEARCVEG